MGKWVNRFYIIDATKPNANYVEMSFDRIVQYLIKPDIISQDDREKDKIITRESKSDSRKISRKSKCKFRLYRKN